ncbi:MAG: polyphosphate kinase 2 family protein [Wenzhouxiangella sp.]
MGLLDTLDLSTSIDKSTYKKRLKTWQLDLLSLQQSVLREGGRMIINVEGMDAAGKGGAIRRLVEKLDPRSYKVYRIGAPADWEQARHYLFRFWTRIPAPGELVIFDRSWYGRVLVERVEGFATDAEWQRAYREINEFERMLTDDGVILKSLWFHVDPDEQLKRFEARLASPFKAWKMSDEDWRNRSRWDDYVTAAEEMFAQSASNGSPWTVIPANCKRYARLTALRVAVEALAAEADRLGIDTPPLTRADF